MGGDCVNGDAYSPRACENRSSVPRSLWWRPLKIVPELESWRKGVGVSTPYSSDVPRIGRKT